MKLLFDQNLSHRLVGALEDQYPGSIHVRDDRAVVVEEGAMLYEIVEAKARPAYRLWIRFADGREGEVDLSSLIGTGVFARWEDPKEFEKVFLDRETRTVAWPGDIDLAPDALYQDLVNEAAA